MFIAQRPTLTEEAVIEDRCSRFVFEPLELGFGYTPGNSLRRMLLSSIPGVAVTSVRIDGVPHEFRAVPGVKEDAAQIILNIKEIVLSSENDESVVMYLRESGPSEVIASDITPPAGVEIHGPDLAITTLNEKGKPEIELTVERGRSYVSANRNKDPNAEISRILVNSIYSPVKKASYSVKATRVEQCTDFDRLIVDVEAKSSITPHDALASAGKTLVELFGLARELNVEAEGIEVGPSPINEAFQQDLALTVDEFDLQARSSNALKREDIHTVGELVSRSEADLLDIRNFGVKLISEIKDKLAGLELSLKGFSIDYVLDDDYANPMFSDETQVRAGSLFTQETTMPRPTKGPCLGGSAQYERHLLANLATQLIVHELIKTTEARARRLRPYVEKLIIKGKRGDLHARRTVLKKVTDKYAVYCLFEELVPKFEGREGGYTRITKTTPRKGNNAPMAVISLVLEPVARKKIVEDAVTTAKKTAQKAVADEGKAEKKTTTEKAEKTDKAGKADRAEHAGTVRLEEDATGAPGDDRPVKGNGDSMKYHVPGSRWCDATVAEVWFISAEDAEVADFAPAGGAAAQKVEK